MASIYCPEMRCDRKRIGLFLTAREPCTFTDDDGTKYPLVIPPTFVRNEFPHQTVDACVGQGDNMLWFLPEEPVRFGIAKPIPTTGTLTVKGKLSRRFTAALPAARSRWQGFGHFVVEAVTAPVIFFQGENMEASQVETTINGHVEAAHANVLSAILQHPEVAAARKQAQAAGIPFIQIIIALLPFVMQLLSGAPLNIQAIIAAILAILNPPKP